jgi:hypothetical protein
LISEIEKVKIIFKETGEKLLTAAGPFICGAIGHDYRKDIYLDRATGSIYPRPICKRCGAR